MLRQFLRQNLLSKMTTANSKNLITFMNSCEGDNGVKFFLFWLDIVAKINNIVRLLELIIGQYRNLDGDDYKSGLA